ncbi:MAG: ATP-binding protein [Desulfovibrionales bacterium]|nr:MAG: ATP-binding protein [Desulfovibrionales bacterium]
MFPRILQADRLARRSCFLWGPRQVGKSTLLRHLFPDAPYYDLLDAALFRRLSANPVLLGEELKALGWEQGVQPWPIIIDEVQKLPELLDEVHRLMAGYGWRFILSGSSARKLRKGGGNLLGGRAVSRELLPLTSREIPDFSLERALNHGMLPAHYLDDDPGELIAAYVGTYLKEEILAESLVRSLPVFQRFLEVAALSNGQPVQFSVMAREVGLSGPGVRGHFEILTDTLLGFWVPAWQKRQKRRIITAPRFYFFDTCLVNDLSRRGELRPGSSAFGTAFEHFILMELRAHCAYSPRSYPISYWRTSSGLEVDAILGNGEVAIEIKSSERPNADHLKGLRAWKEEHPPSRCILVSQAHASRITEDDIEILPWKVFLDLLWADALHPDRPQTTETTQR